MILKYLLVFNVIAVCTAEYFDYFHPCAYGETCDCGISDPWVRNPGGVDHDTKVLKEFLENRLYGQPLVINEISHAIANHINKKFSNKALSIALHGLAGTGKSYTGKIIGEFLYKLGMQSQFAHIFLGGIRNCGEHKDCLRNHQVDIHRTIIKTLHFCKHALFIIDEVDDMPSSVLNSLMSFLDEQSNVFGVDPRQSIFIFLSNSGSDEIARKTKEYHDQEIPRDQIPSAVMEQIIRNNAYVEEVKEGEFGFQESKLLKRNLIQYHLPFLPLEREHVMQCIKYYLETKGQYYSLSSNFIRSITEEVEFVPKESPIFSLYGCRPIEKIADKLLNAEMKKFTINEEL